MSKKTVEDIGTVIEFLVIFTVWLVSMVPYLIWVNVRALVFACNIDVIVEGHKALLDKMLNDK